MSLSNNEVYLRILFCVTMITFFCTGLSAQTATRSEEAEGIKKAVGIIAAGKKPNVEIVLRDLREFEGRIIGVYDDSFRVDPKQPRKTSITIISIGNVPNNRKPPVTIKYRDVLQVEGKGMVLSVVPDPKSATFAGWQDIPTAGIGAMLQVHTKDGKKTHGVFTTWSDDKLTLMQGNAQTEIEKKEVTRIYQLAGNLDGLRAKLFGGGRRGAEVADSILPIMDAMARANPFALMIGAAIGVATVALMHVLPKGGIKRVLLYAT